MTRRPPMPPDGNIRRAHQRMAPGGRLWSESPVKGPAVRVVAAGDDPAPPDPPPFAEYRGPFHYEAWPDPGTDWPDLSTLTLQTGPPTTGQGLLVVTFTSDAAVIPPTGWTQVGQATAGRIYWGVWWAEVGLVSDYVFSKGAATGKDAMFVWSFDDGTPTPEVRTSAWVGESANMPKGHPDLTNQVAILVGLATPVTPASTSFAYDPTSPSNPYHYPFTPLPVKVEGRPWTTGDITVEGAGLTLASFYEPDVSLLTGEENVQISSQEYIGPGDYDPVTDTDYLSLNVGWVT